MPDQPNPAPAAPEDLLDAVWQDQARWSLVAGQLKRGLGFWRGTAAIASVAGVVCTTAATQLGSAPAAPALATAGALLLALVPYVLRQHVSAARIAAWNRARATSEALKEQVHRYLLGAAPYDAGGGLVELLNRIEDAKKNVADLGLQAAAVPAAQVQRPEAQPRAMAVDTYVQRRLLGQADGFYLPKAQAAAHSARQLRGLEYGLGLLALVMGVLITPVGEPLLGAAVVALLSPWVAVVTTAGGAVTAHLAAARHETLASTYYATAERLRGLHRRWLLNPERQAPAEVAALVDAVEKALSTENGAWMADWARGEA